MSKTVLLVMGNKSKSSVNLSVGRIGRNNPLRVEESKLSNRDVRNFLKKGIIKVVKDEVMSTKSGKPKDDAKAKERAYEEKVAREEAIIAKEEAEEESRVKAEAKKVEEEEKAKAIEEAEKKAKAEAKAKAKAEEEKESDAIAKVQADAEAKEMAERAEAEVKSKAKPKAKKKNRKRN